MRKVKLSTNRFIKKGFTLVEILVVIFVFSILAVVTTQVIQNSLRGSKKSETTVRIKQSIDYALGVMERELHSAQELESCTTSQINYSDSEGISKYFYCSDLSNRLIFNGEFITDSEVQIADCTNAFTCQFPSGSPHYVDISFSASSAVLGGIEDTQVTVDTRILLRNYN